MAVRIWIFVRQCEYVIVLVYVVVAEDIPSPDSTLLDQELWYASN